MKRFRVLYLGLLFAVYAAVSLLTRLALLYVSGLESLEGASVLPRIFGAGFLNDVLPFFWLTLPLAALVLLPGERSLSRWTRWGLAGLFALFAALFLFTGTAEVIFWEEFVCRFNFIAVDYLIYTSEVIGNIMESYPVLPLLAAVGGVAAVLTGLILHPLFRRVPEGTVVPAARGWFGVWVIMALLTWPFSPLGRSENVVERELAANGVWSLFSAFQHNQLDYGQFYPSIDKAQALNTLRAELEAPDTAFIYTTGATGDAEDTTVSVNWQRRVTAQGPERHWNVVQIVVESLGSASLGERTPNLNAVAAQSLRFTRLMATGTRTVRGIEALTLSIPPTPGASIVRRPDNEGLFTAGSVFRSRGYDTSFIYGGYGYFDNMNAFFAGNGYRVVDRAVIPDSAKTFGNVWGVCDEDLLDTALREADASYAAGKPFHQFVLTTSNHRPFTYPDGRIDIPSGTSRSGAIKYTDYAIGRFLREAAQKPWFKDTVFVIVADHTAGSAGKTDLPPENYAVPCLVYSPGNIQPGVVDTLCSQIDVAPTLFALLGWSYDSGFFGNNILAMAPERGRAWIGTYQLLGRLTNEGLVVLEPFKRPRVVARPDSDEQTLIDAALAGYQTAQERFTSGAMRLSNAMASGVRTFLVQNR